MTPSSDTHNPDEIQFSWKKMKENVDAWASLVGSHGLIHRVLKEF